MIKMIRNSAVIVAVGLSICGCDKTSMSKSQQTGGKDVCARPSSMRSGATAGRDACCPVGAKEGQGTNAQPVLPPGHPPISGAVGAGAAADHIAAPAAQTFTGEVLETMNTSGYTYVLVASGTNQVWAAATQFEVKKGDKVTIPLEMPMRNFTSPSLKRTFELIYFTSKITPAGKGE